MAGAKRRVYDLRAVGQRLAAHEHAREQHLIGVRGEAQDDARRVGAAGRHPAGETAPASGRCTASGARISDSSLAGRARRAGLPLRQLLRRARVRRHVHPDAGNRLAAAGPAAPAAALP